MAYPIDDPETADAEMKAAFQALTGVAVIVDVTTGAAPVDIDLADYGNWIIMAVRITSGGTAGVEVLNFIGPDGDLADTSVGRSINVVFTTQTDPGDIIHITQNSGGNISCIDTLGNSVGQFDTAIFDEEGNNISFGFNGDVILQYRWNCLYGAWDSPTVISGKRNPLPQDGNYGQFPLANGDGVVAWSNGSITPFPVFNGGTVAALNSNYPAGSNPRGMAVVYDADTPVVGSVVVGGGASPCVVIANAAVTDYVVMFILP